MKILNFLKNSIKYLSFRAVSQASVEEAAKIDARQYERFFLCRPQIIRIILENNPEINIVNISYGGFAIANSFESEPIPGKRQQAILKYFDLEVPAFAQMLYSSKKLCGYMFEHQNTDTLVFLREIIEYLRYGSTLRVLDPRLLKDKYQSGDWTYLRGEGATDLAFKLKDEVLSEFLCTFRSGEVYQELCLKDGVFTTGKSLDREGVGSRMQATLDLDKAILRRAMAILLGLKDEYCLKNLQSVFDFAKSVL